MGERPASQVRSVAGLRAVEHALGAWLGIGRAGRDKSSGLSAMLEGGGNYCVYGIARSAGSATRGLELTWCTAPLVLWSVAVSEDLEVGPGELVVRERQVLCAGVHCSRGHGL